MPHVQGPEKTVILEEIFHGKFIKSIKVIKILSLFLLSKCPGQGSLIKKKIVISYRIF
jgi:hypothetical protein